MHPWIDSALSIDFLALSIDFLAFLVVMTKAASSKLNVINTGVVVCSALLVQQLVQARIPPNYIGVRCVSNPTKAIQGNKTNGQQQATMQSDVVFKVTEADGTERRMTRQEKKTLRRKLTQEKKTLAPQESNAKKRKTLSMDTGIATVTPDVTSTELQPPTDTNSGHSLPTSNPSTKDASVKYHQLSVDATAMQEELEEFSGDRREGLPPVILSPPMARCAANLLGASQSPTTPTSAASQPPNARLQYDEELSQTWAQLLKESMLPAEMVRQTEDMRPMAYQLMPEAWTRMRQPNKDEPGPHRQQLETTISNASFETTTTTGGSIFAQSDSDTIPSSKSWLVQNCRPPSRWDVVTAVVFEYFHRETTFHVSCGAKFGADFLVYDGPRSERHAFAGLRVLLPKSSPNGDGLLPVPTAYDMAGYVRCLNTAGKLALLATVVEDEICSPDRSSSMTLYRVAVVDLALEKILTAPTHQRHARTEKRRDVSRNLAKNK